MNFDVHLSEAALDQLLETSGRDFLDKVGRAVRDGARTNAEVITDKTAAITTERGSDADGPFVDVGYAKHHPGFFLWWWEVGTRNHAPRPHLVPALRPGLF